MKRHYVGKMHPHHLDKTETGNFEQVLYTFQQTSKGQFEEEKNHG
jgi:hypothetical protein